MSFSLAQQQKKAKRMPEYAVEVDKGQNGSFRSLKDLKEVAFEELGETDEVSLHYIIQPPGAYLLWFIW